MIETLLGISIPRGPYDPYSTRITAYICIPLVAISILYLFRFSTKNKIWERGEIPKSFKLSPKNIFEIYIASATAIITRDPRRMSGKYVLLSQKLSRKFPNEFRVFSDKYIFSIRYTLKIESLSEWMNSYFNENQKIDLIEFLIEISISDGVMESGERAFIVKLMSQLNITDAAINHDSKKKLFEDIKQKVDSKIGQKSKRLNALEVLGLSEIATLLEIKTAYRSLAKLTHPDRFNQESDEKQLEMKRRFQLIQDAYDYLNKL